MLKTIIFLSVIVKLAFGDEIIDDEDIIDENEVSMSLDVMEALVGLNIDDNDELNEIETEINKRCLEIDRRVPCQKAVTPVAPNGRQISSPIGVGGKGAYIFNIDNEQGGCVYFPSKNSRIVQVMGGRCLSPTAVFKYLRRQKLRAGNGPDDQQEEIMAKDGLLMTANQGSQFDINYIIATIAVIGLLISFGVLYKCKNNGKESSITSSERTSLYQSV